jgi:hypothetical protein
MGRKTVQAVTAAQEWRERMRKARNEIPAGIGQQDVLIWIVAQQPELDRLTNANRWHNAWLGRVADPEITVLVEQAATHYQTKQKETRQRLSRQKLNRVCK